MTPTPETEMIAEPDVDPASALRFRKANTDVIRANKRRRYRVALAISLTVLVGIFLGGIVVFS